MNRLTLMRSEWKMSHSVHFDIFTQAAEILLRSHTGSNNKCGMTWGGEKLRKEVWVLPVTIKLLILLLAVVLSLPSRRVCGRMNRKRNNYLHIEIKKQNRKLQSHGNMATTKAWFIWVWSAYCFMYKNHFPSTETSQRRATGHTAAIFTFVLWLTH